jgi:YD repeat-containing protein
VQTDYSYDCLDRMTGYKDSAGGTESSYEYDALDRMTRQREKHGTAPARVTSMTPWDSPRRSPRRSSRATPAV